MSAALTRVLTVESFWSRVDQSGDCWTYTGARNRRGYGRLGSSELTRLIGERQVHRFVWATTFGPIPDGLWVLHRCDNPPCVNPAHLFLGDHLANMRDMVIKGRSTRGRRQSHCGRGHDQSVHGRMRSDGKRHCQACHNERRREASHALAS